MERVDITSSDDVFILNPKRCARVLLGEEKSQYESKYGYVLRSTILNSNYIYEGQLGRTCAGVLLILTSHLKSFGYNLWVTRSELKRNMGCKRPEGIPSIVVDGVTMLPCSACNEYHPAEEFSLNSASGNGKRPACIIAQSLFDHLKWIKGDGNGGPYSKRHRTYLGRPFYDLWNPDKGGSLGTGAKSIRAELGPRPVGYSLHCVIPRKGVVPGNLIWAPATVQVAERTNIIHANQEHRIKELEQQNEALEGDAILGQFYMESAAA